MAEKTEVVTTPEAEPETESLDTKMTKFVGQKYGEAVAAENSAEAVTETTEAPAADAPADEPAEEPAPKAEELFTTEQLSDPKFWDRLDKAGWEKAAKLHPVETSRVKAGYAAASKIAEEARKAKPEPKEERDDSSTQKLSPEMTEVLRKIDSLDPAERAEGLDSYVELKMAEKLPKFGFNPNQAKAAQLASSAYDLAVAELPDLGKIDLQVLDAAVESDPVLLALVSTGNVQNVAVAMKRAGENVIAKQKADQDKAAAEQRAKDAKTKETQRKVKSNASIPSNVVVESPAGSAPTDRPKGQRTDADMQKFVDEQYDAAVAAESR